MVVQGSTAGANPVLGVFMTGFVMIEQ